MASNANTHENQSVAADTMPSPNLYQYNEVLARSPAQTEEFGRACCQLEHDLQMQDQEDAVRETVVAQRKRARQEASWDRASERRALRDEKKQTKAKVKTEAKAHGEDGVDTEDDATSPAVDDEPVSKVGRARANHVSAVAASVVAPQAIQSSEAVVEQALHAEEEACDAQQSGRGPAPFAGAAKDCAQVHSSAEEDGSPNTTMTRLTVRAGGASCDGAPLEAEEQSADKARPAAKAAREAAAAQVDDEQKEGVQRGGGRVREAYAYSYFTTLTLHLTLTSGRGMGGGVCQGGRSGRGASGAGWRQRGAS